MWNEVEKYLPEALSNPCSCIVVLIALWLLNRAMGTSGRTRYLAGAGGAAVWILSLAGQLYHWKPDTAGPFHIVLRSTILSLTTIAALILVIPVHAFVWDQTFGRLERWWASFKISMEIHAIDRKAKRLNKQKEMRLERERRERERYMASLPPPVPPPPPPDPFDVAEQEYQKALARIERSALSQEKKDIAKEDLHEQYARKLFDL